MAPEFLYRTCVPFEEYSTDECSINCTNSDPPIISNYDDLIAIAGEVRPRKVYVRKLRDFDLEPLFNHFRRINSKPSIFIRLQDVMTFIRELEPPPPPRQQRTMTDESNDTLSPFLSISMPTHGTRETNTGSYEMSDQYRLQRDVWERNLGQFIHTANTLMGNFHGHLPYSWLNHDYLNRSFLDPGIKKLPRVPTLEEFNQSRYSISAFPRIKYGIKVVGKEVSLQTLSFTDFRYHCEDEQIVGSGIIWKYYCNGILKLSKIIPNKRSFDIAVDVGMIPEGMLGMVDFPWWSVNVIKFGREIEYIKPVLSGDGYIDINKKTYELFNTLSKEYYSFFKTVRRDLLWEQYKYNPVQLILNIITCFLTLAGVVFAVTGVLQVLQGFCYFGDQYC
ncbi:hypothetical protein BDA99DRAFT_523478 [Phascolomyces articulosus]|uniref:Uncharacterized protein n=1 Tax=Phascolomyces articulosus TaxID=60185 RepID=A0AAD5JR81_9FUNG|nr:hypothetical protein BDA99DRAFT_523478 [Phascolomyces articulosus]